MMRIFLMIVVSFLSLIPRSPCWAKTLYDGPATTYDSSATSVKELITETSTGATETTAHIVYVPVNISTSSESRLKATFLPSLPTVDSTLSTAPRLTLAFHHDEGTGKSLYAAVKKSDNTYQIVVTPFSIEGNTIYTLNLPFYDLCQMGTCNLDNFSPGNGEVNDGQYIYVFAAATGTLALGQTVDLVVEGNKNGVYFNVKFSSQFSSDKPKLLKALKGDGKLIMTYDSSPVSTFYTAQNFYRIVSINFDSKSQSTSIPFRTAKSLASSTGIQLHESKGINSVGVSNLQNGTTYNIGLALMNKFQFVTPVTETLAGSPMEIEAFLKEQSCFLLSAGFQERHYVLDFFRQWRDQVLLKNSLGRKFVYWYYSWSPKMAPTIYRSPALSLIVRTLGYIAYFFIYHFILLGKVVLSLVLVVLALLFCFFLKPHLKHNLKHKGRRNGSTE